MTTQSKIDKKEKMVAGVTKKLYESVHQWLRCHYGKADRCDNSPCKGVSKKYCYALKKGFKYERKIENFIKMCRSCHIIYDWTEDGRKRMSLLHMGVRPYLRHNIECRLCKDIIIKPHPCQLYCLKCRKKVYSDLSRNWAIKNKERVRIVHYNYYLKHKNDNKKNNV
jgi:hypothetical protein